MQVRAYVRVRPRARVHAREAQIVEMNKTLVIAEKPSVAQDIVRALTPVAGKFDKHDDHFENEKYVVTSAVGHLDSLVTGERDRARERKIIICHGGYSAATAASAPRYR